MSLLWVICGAGRRVGKTHLARRLCEMLPNSVYAKQGHGRPKKGKCANFFRSSREVEAFVAAQRGRREHVVVESNALARAGCGDVIVYVEAPPGRADVRSDAAALRSAAHVQVAGEARPGRWRAVLRAVPIGPKLRRAVCRVLADQAEFLARRRLTARTKVWLAAGGAHAFGAGLADLLGEIERLGSLRRAAEQAGMSYRYAWKLIRTAEAHLGRPLLVTRSGGARGGGSEVSPDGHRLLATFRRLDAEVAEFAAGRLAALYGKGAAGS